MNGVFVVCLLELSLVVSNSYSEEISFVFSRLYFGKLVVPY